jgi:phage terminase large subunit-like protein
LRNFTINGRPKKLAKQVTEREVIELSKNWLYWARENQQLPPGEADFRNWIILGGRGSGKTRAGAEWVKALVFGLFEPYISRCARIAIVAPTFDEARMVMIEGESGLLAQHLWFNRPKWEPSKRRLTWENGAIAEVFSAEEPDGLRGPNFDAAWCDEMAKWKKADAAWSNLQLALRIGQHPHAVITTTPRPTALMRSLINEAETLITRSRTGDNKGFLAPQFLDAMLKRFQGSALARQELDGEMIADDPDALFKRADIDRVRVMTAPQMKRIVVAIDPPATDHAKANACGIVAAGLGVDGRCYVLADRSAKRLSPLKWAERAVRLFDELKADRIIAEANQGGAMVGEVLKQARASIPLRLVHATRSKRARAEPVAALYEQGRISHVGSWPELEDEMCISVEKGESPDRMDALVWAVTELMLKPKTEPRVRGI